MLKQVQLLSLLDKVLKQTARIRKGNEAVYFCPFCQHHKKKLEINLDTQLWECWVCHNAGRTIKSLFKKLNVHRKYYEELYQIIGYKDFKQINEKNSEENEYHYNIALPSEFISLSKYSKSIEYAFAYSYLEKRGITKEDIIRYNIGYCEKGEYEKRIIIPSYDNNGNLNFFSSRSYYENSFLKYKNPPWSKNIIGFELFINWGEPITLVEGAFDAVAVRNNAIPLFGTTLSMKLKESIIKYGVNRINILLDNDALQKAIKIYEFLEKISNDDIDIHLIKLENDDPSVLGFEKINEMIRSSKPFGYKELIRMKMSF